MNDHHLEVIRNNRSLLVTSSRSEVERKQGREGRQERILFPLATVSEVRSARTRSPGDTYCVISTLTKWTSASARAKKKTTEGGGKP